MHKVFLGVLVFVAGSAMHASAEYLMTTEQLKRACATEGEMGSCLSYISGVADQFAIENYMSQTLKQSGVPARDCIIVRIPEHVQATDLRDLVLKYVEKKPFTLQNPAVVTVGAALSEAYPCVKL